MRAKVSTPEQTIEDACQNAWAILLRRQNVPLNDTGAAWLTTVAIREGWRLTRSSEVPMGAMRPGTSDEGELPEPAATGPGTDEQAITRVQHAQRVAALRTLKTRERRDLYLLALGYRYREIADLTGSTYTAVNRRLSEGRPQLRRQTAEAAEESDDDEEGANFRRRRPTHGMSTLQPITYRRTVAAVTRSRFFLAALDLRPEHDPERTFVIFRCAYAGDVLSGLLPGPYSDENARRYARAARPTARG